jgi:hypothetical protein
LRAQTSDCAGHRRFRDRPRRNVWFAVWRAAVSNPCFPELLSRTAANTFPCGFTVTVGQGIDPEFTSGGGNGANQGEGAGRVFYFRPGHETVPTYYNENVQKVIYNGVLWCARRS